MSAVGVEKYCQQGGDHVGYGEVAVPLQLERTLDIITTVLLVIVCGIVGVHIPELVHPVVSS